MHGQRAKQRDTRQLSADLKGTYSTGSSMTIKNLVLTVPGEKPFQPLVGSRVNELLFEPLDPFIADSIKDEIINTIKQHEPRVDLTEVTVLPVYERNQINVSVEYRIVGLPIVENITFVLQRPE